MYCIIVQYIIADLGWNYQCSVLLVICEGNTQVAGGFPLETASKKSFYIMTLPWFYQFYKLR